MDDGSHIKKQLFKELRDKHYLWSYDHMAMNEHSLTDEQLIEKVLMHLDMQSINQLFLVFPKRYIKEVWKQHLCPLEPRYHSTNVLFATIFFDIKNPHRYIKTQASRMIRKNTHQHDRSTPKNRKSSYYCNNQNKKPEEMKIVPVKDNLGIADVYGIGVMKLEVMLRRSTFRDYYDIYSIIRAGGDLAAIVEGALRYSGHKLRTRDILSMLLDHTRFSFPKSLDALSPKYNVSASEIEVFLRPHIQQYNKKIVTEQRRLG